MANCLSHSSDRQRILQYTKNGDICQLNAQGKPLKSLGKLRAQDVHNATAGSAQTGAMLTAGIRQQQTDPSRTALSTNGDHQESFQPRIFGAVPI
jgi:hypothetical protein